MTNHEVILAKLPMKSKIIHCGGCQSEPDTITFQIGVKCIYIFSESSEVNAVLEYVQSDFVKFAFKFQKKNLKK